MDCFGLQTAQNRSRPESCQGKSYSKQHGIRDALTVVVRLPARIDERAQLDWSGSWPHDRGLMWLTTGGETQSSCIFRLFKCELTERRAKTRRSRSRGGPREKTLGSNKGRKLVRQSIFKRLARRRGSFGPIAVGILSPHFDRAALRTAWKYVYLLRAGNRLTRYVE
jgi:hypothetical protein